MLRLVVLVFSAIQTVLTLRLLRGFIDLPPDIDTLIRNVSGPLIAPFTGFDLPRAMAPAARGFEAPVLVALIGWSVLELVIVTVLSVLSRRSSSDS
jgi:hypothetical protein